MTTGAATSPPPLPLVRRRRFVVRTLIITFMAVLAFMLGFRVIQTRAVRQLEDRIRARGEPLTLVDLAERTPIIADADNAANAFIELWSKDHPAFLKAFLANRRPLPSRQTEKFDQKLPYLGDKRDWLSVPRRDPLPADRRAAADHYLTNNQRRLLAIQEILRTRSKAQFPVVITNGLDALLPHLPELRKEANAFRIATLVALDEGRTGDAIASVECGIQLGHLLKTEPFIVGQLVQTRIYIGAMDDLERLLTRHRLHTEDLVHVGRMLEQVTLAGALGASLRSERAMQRTCFEDTEAFVQWVTAKWEPGDAQSLRLVLAVSRALGISAADRRFYLTTLERAIELSSNDSPDALGQIESLLKAAPERANTFPQYLISGRLLSGLRTVPGRFSGLEARRRAALVAVAIERFKSRHGDRLPARLTDLVPDFLPSVPVDPFTGKPLEFDLRATGYVIYSIGSDRVDQGGRERMDADAADDFDETFVVER